MKRHNKKPQKKNHRRPKLRGGAQPKRRCIKWKQTTPRKLSGYNKFMAFNMSGFTGNKDEIKKMFAGFAGDWRELSKSEKKEWTNEKWNENK